MNKNLEEIQKLLKNKKVIIPLIILALIIILSISIPIRTQNSEYLVDQTTGKTIPLALDPYYFLRIAETKVANNGTLPEFDAMRGPAIDTKWNPEILPDATIFTFKVLKVFNPDITLQKANVLSPVIYFALSLIIFFFLVSYLTNSKILGIISTLFLAITPAFLYRTMQGFSDHEALGMLAFFIFLLSLAFVIKKISKKPNTKNAIFLSLLVGLTTAFTIASWGGIAVFAYLITGGAFFIFWIQESNKEKTNNLHNLIIFYFTWLISTPIIAKILFSYPIESITARFITSTQGIPILFIGFLALVDLINIKLLEKNRIKYELNKKYRLISSIIITLLLGFIAISITQGGPIEVVKTILDKFIHPFGENRLGLTVAENKQPYLQDWVNQMGTLFFITFIIGLITFGYTLTKNSKSYKNKILIFSGWSIMMLGMIFSRISPQSLLNGVNMISKTIYFSSIIIFTVILARTYLKKDLRMGPITIVLFSWIFFMVMSGRGAARLFFVITPLVILMATYPSIKLFKIRTKIKDNTMKTITTIIAIITIIFLILSLVSQYNSVKIQASNTRPSANAQWQNAMSWVRNNTATNDIFIHWWDYGYWIQYLGERATVTDGGHPAGYWNHLIGRYLLTTPNPNTALSLMKSHNASYLLLDPTDIGKYSAYSSIGNDAEKNDRYSFIPTFRVDQSQTLEEKNQTTLIYPAGTNLDQDIIYETNGTKIFLPKEKSALAAIILQIKETQDNENEIFQPQAVFITSQNQQIRIPLKYIHYNNQLIEFDNGIKAGIVIKPLIKTTNQGVTLNQIGTAYYLSERTFPSLFAQLYLMDDPQNLYPTIKIAHTENSPIINAIKSSSGEIDEIAYYDRGGTVGPIKIYRVEYPDYIQTIEGFTSTVGEFGGLDDEVFRE